MCVVLTLSVCVVLIAVVCFDAKINFDDSAKFRQAAIFEQEDTSESDLREVEAAKYDLNYIGMTGNIGCLGESHDLSQSHMISAFLMSQLLYNYYL